MSSKIYCTYRAQSLRTCILDVVDKMAFRLWNDRFDWLAPANQIREKSLGIQIVKASQQHSALAGCPQVEQHPVTHAGACDL